MIMTLKVLGREIAIVHDADEEQYKEFFEDVVSAAFKACSQGEKIYMIASFKFAPIIPIHISIFSSNDNVDNETALKKIKEELYLPDTTFSNWGYIQEKTGQHPREILAQLIAKELS